MKNAKKFVEKYKLQIVIWGSVVVLTTWVSVYFFRFHGRLSPSQSDWADFSNYISAVTGLLSLFILSFLTYVIHKESTSIKIKLEKPVLTFSFNSEKGHYYCTNIGKGPAINVMIIHKLNEEQDFYDLGVKCISLPINDGILITWIKGTFELIVIYYDIFNIIHGRRFINNKMEEMIFDEKKTKSAEIVTFSIESNIEKIYDQKVLDWTPLYDAVNIKS